MPAEALAGLRILIVEDEALVGMDLEYTCVDHGAEAVLVPTISSAVEALNAGGFDAAILDISLPDGTSIELARQLSREKVPFVFHSGDAASSVRFDFAEVPFCPKPTAPDDLIMALAGAVTLRPQC